jgi:hypothetical protein
MDVTTATSGKDSERLGFWFRRGANQSEIGFFVSHV